MSVLRTLYINLIKETDVGFDGSGDFGNADELIGTVGTGGFARSLRKRCEVYDDDVTRSLYNLYMQ